jgi:hypothetical protein
MPHKYALVAEYDSHRETEQSIKDLEKAGFEMKQLSIVGKAFESENRVVGYSGSGERMKHWGKCDAFWSGMWRVLDGAAFLVIPEIGPMVLAGPLVSALAGALQSTAASSGLNALALALRAVGIPEGTLARYESGVRANKFIVIALGTRNELERTRRILARNSHHVKIHAGSEVEAPLIA